MPPKIGSPVMDCPAAGAPTAGKTGATHKTCGIKILSIREQDNEEGYEFKDSQAEIDVKSLNKPLRIRYEVKACAMSVTLWVEFDPGNKVHAKFYGAYDGNGIDVPRVAVVVQGEAKSPGVHEALWDGRDQTSDHRILLAGAYKVRILGLEDLTHKDVTSVKMAPPMAWNHGIHYASKGMTQSTKKEVESARDKQKSLADGTAFLSEATASAHASVAWGNMRISAVSVISGHSGPVNLCFYPEESQPGKPAVFKRNKQSLIVTAGPASGKSFDAENSVNIADEPANSLRDVFFILLAGCMAGNEFYLVQSRLNKLSKGLDPGPIDGIHGRKTTAALKCWQEWEKIEPADGAKNETTLAALGVDPSLSEREQTRAVQKKLKNFSKRYNPGKLDGAWGDKTESALTHYQEDHSPPLEVNSLPDKPTLKHLKLDDVSGPLPNIAESFIQRGCNIAFGFKNKVGFKGGEKWHIAFWDLAAKGSGIDDAASEARSLCGAVYRKELEYNIFTRDGVDRNSTLHPARHGRDM